MNRYIDTHTHLFVEEFSDDRDAVVKRALDAGVTKLCLPGITADSMQPIKDMCDKYPGVCFAMAGLHPTELGDDYKEQLDRIKACLDNDGSIVAVGEVGIDLYWDDTRLKEQTEVFEAQISWAREKGLPLAIHTRNAFGEMCGSLQRCGGKELTGVFHCFTGTKEEAEALLSFEGFMFGIGGVVTYKKNTLAESLPLIPLERILLETDSPYLSPVPCRGRRNESSYIPYIAQRVADIYGTDVETVACITTENAERLFAI